MKKIVLFIALIASALKTTGQNEYSWPQEKISITSPEKLEQIDTESGLYLEGNGLKIEISILQGMEGISALEESLMAFASSFNYALSDKIKTVNDLKNLKSAVGNAKKEDKLLIISILSSLDYKKHYFLEISYLESEKKNAWLIFKSLQYGKNTIETPIKNEDNNYAKTDVEKIARKILSEYATDGYTIIDEYFKAPKSYQGRTVFGTNGFVKWIDGTSENDVVKSLNTVVHEMCHAFTGKLFLKAMQEKGLPVDNDEYSAFYLGNKEVKLVKHTRVFRTNEIHSIYPEKLKSFRYETYVYPSMKLLGAQKDGIYGLLDELNAYYQGTKTTLDLYPYYAKYQNNNTGWLQFFSDFYGTYYAYLEFKSYMLFYMIYAEKHQKEVYSEILQNEDFIEAFKKTDDNWWNLIEKFILTKQEIISNIRNNGLEISENSKFITIENQGVGNFVEQYNIFMDELKAPRYEKIAKLFGLQAAYGPEIELAQK